MEEERESEGGRGATLKHDSAEAVCSINRASLRFIYNFVAKLRDSAAIVFLRNALWLRLATRSAIERVWPPPPPRALPLSDYVGSIVSIVARRRRRRRRLRRVQLL